MGDSSHQVLSRPSLKPPGVGRRGYTARRELWTDALPAESHLLHAAEQASASCWGQHQRVFKYVSKERIQCSGALYTYSTKDAGNWGSEAWNAAGGVWGAPGRGKGTRAAGGKLRSSDVSTPGSQIPCKRGKILAAPPPRN